MTSTARRNMLWILQTLSATVCSKSLMLFQVPGVWTYPDSLYVPANFRRLWPEGTFSIPVSDFPTVCQYGPHSSNSRECPKFITEREISECFHIFYCLSPLNVTVCTLYFPPCDNISPTDLSDLISELPTPFIIVGDFSAHHSMWGSTRDLSERQTS